MPQSFPQEPEVSSVAFPAPILTNLPIACASRAPAVGVLGAP